MLDRTLKEYNFKICWEESNISVYSNEIICMFIVEEEKSYNIKIDYIETFTKWTNAWYENTINKDSNIEFDIIHKEIKDIISIRDKAIIKSSEGCYSVNFDVVKKYFCVLNI